ncbi:hypothetical protein MNB_SV-8-702 [hydrothermal vent metagenome]|uniref:Uncharacterized protein n=1 Tax=hydrothermal vent metagenome TaxID=652676 RepID=A0A1W1BCT4_9ZZZZ
MLRLRKLITHHTAYTLGRRVFCCLIGMCRLIVQHFMVKLVILFISGYGVVIYVVGMCPFF